MEIHGTEEKRHGLHCVIIEMLHGLGTAGEKRMMFMARDGYLCYWVISHVNKVETSYLA